jgi:hypothetical protein
MKTLACVGCVSSAFGDRTFGWAYLTLVVAPFVVVAAIAAVLAWKAGIRPRLIVHRLAERLFGRRAALPGPLPHKETT